MTVLQFINKILEQSPNMDSDVEIAFHDKDRIEFDFSDTLGNFEKIEYFPNSQDVGRLIITVFN